jgi:hypothetical protein
MRQQINNMIDDEIETPPLDLETLNSLLCLITITSETIRDYSDEKKQDVIDIINIVKAKLESS